MGTKLLTADDLANIILCEPITSRGREALGSLGLQGAISADDFFNEMHICSKYLEKKSDDASIARDQYDDLGYVYDIPEETFAEMKEQLERFDRKLTSDSKNQSPLLILGAAGNGKSIEAGFKLHSIEHCGGSRHIKKVIFNLEESFTELTYEVTYKLSEKREKDALCLVYMTMMNELYKLVKSNADKTDVIASNHKKFFIEESSANDIEKKFFRSVEEYVPGNSKKVEALFKSIIALVDGSVPKNAIINLLKMTMNLMYCIDPASKNYIVFDNFEHYIKLNILFVPIPEKSIKMIYYAIEKAMGNMSPLYSRIAPDELWRAFKVVLVLRRASTHLIAQSDAHYATKFLSIGNDYTGHFDIWRIWKKKKEFVFDKHLKDRYKQTHAKKILFIMDDMMTDAPGSDHQGTTYQRLIAPLMNFGIRRNARTQAYAATSVYEILNSSRKSGIDYEIFEKLLPQANRKNAIRYLYRRALLEIQFKRMISSSDSKPRFEKLCLGKINSSVFNESGEKARGANVIFDKEYPNNITLVRRILSYLSSRIDKSIFTHEDGKTFKTHLFSTISIHELMGGIFLNDVERNGTNSQKKILNTEEHYLPMAKILLSMGNMSYSQTNGAPLVIIDVDHTKIVQNDLENSSARLLEAIWREGEGKQEPGVPEKYSDYRIRLTDAGNAFLLDVQPSFSFFAAQSCSEEHPLFFLCDPERIKNVIQSVYSLSEIVCNRYELAANSFCGISGSLENSKCLPTHKEKRVSFRERVIQLHSSHLNLYRDYINSMASTIGLTDESKEEVLKCIREIKKRYAAYSTANKCF